MVTYGQAFSLQTPDATSITNVNWIRLPSVTHAFDQNQRLNTLSFSLASGGLDVTAPDNANLTPPGHYMLFILNGDGVPSVAKIIQISEEPVLNVTRYVAPPPTGNDAFNKCTDPAHPCATLAHAVSQANAGDIIELATGIYNEPGLVIDKALNIQGQDVIVQ